VTLSCLTLSRRNRNKVRAVLFCRDVKPSVPEQQMSHDWDEGGTLRAEDLSQKFGNDHAKILAAAQTDNSIDPDTVLNALRYADANAKQAPFDATGGQTNKDVWSMLGGIVNGVTGGAVVLGQQTLDTLKSVGDAFMPAANRSRMQLLNDALTAKTITPEQYQTTMQQIRSGLQNNALPEQQAVSPAEAQLQDTQGKSGQVPVLPQEQAQIDAGPLVQARAKAELIPGLADVGAQDLQALETAYRAALGIEVNSPIGSWIRALGGPAATGDIDPRVQMALMKLPYFPIPVQSAQNPATQDDDQRLMNLAAGRMQANLTKQRLNGYNGPIGQTIEDAWNKNYTPQQLSDLGYPVRPEHVESISSIGQQISLLPAFEIGGAVSEAMGLDSVLNTASGYLLRGTSRVAKAGQDILAAPTDLTSAALGGASNVVAKHPSIAGGAAMTGIGMGLKYAMPNVHIPLHGELVSFFIARPLGEALSPYISTGLHWMSLGAGGISKGIRFLTQPLTDGLDLAGQDMLHGDNLLAPRASWDLISGKTSPMSAEDLANMRPGEQLPKTGQSGLVF